MRTLDAVSPLVREVLRRLRERVEAGVGALAMSLFGSYARGDADEDSDVDVLIVLDAATPHARAIVDDVAARLYPELGLLVHPIVFGRDEYERRLAGGHPLLRTIAREGIVA